MIAFLNPHAHDFLAMPVSFVLLKRRGLKKYGFLFEQLIQHQQTIHVVLDGTVCSLIPDRFFNRLPRFLRHMILKLEMSWWLALNQLQKNVRVHFSAKTCPSVKTLFMFSYKDGVGSFDRRRQLIESFPLVLVHLSHYMIRTAEKAKNLSTLSNVTLMGDSDISSNSYFKTYFSWYKRKLFILPFHVSERFQISTNFAKRQKKCIAVGSFHDLTQEILASYYHDFTHHFDTDTYHPVRKILYANASQNQNWLTCHISPYRETSNPSRSRIKNWLKYFFVRQKNYFKINMVEEYNHHQFALVGEELNGFPALGAFEAMACGCVLLARSDEYYQGLNLQAGKHYLLHDGTVEGIRKVVEEAAANQGQTLQISEEACRYVNRCMRGQFSYDSLMGFVQTQLSQTKLSA